MRTLSLALLASLALFGCSAAVDSDSASDETEDQGEAALSNPNYGYFVAKQDFRKCAYPMCGGYFVSRVNASKTRCIDGSYAASCYVTGIDLSAIGLDGIDAGHAVFRGTIAKQTINAKTWSVLKAGEAWVGQTTSDATGSFYRVKDNGIRCIKAPCNSIGASKLNTNAVRTLSDLDLASTDTPATQKQIDAAIDGLFDSDGVLVAGTISTTKNGGHALVASEFYQKATGIRYCGSRGLSTPCNKDEYCAYSVNANCGRADAGGTCTVKPQVCIQLYKPVCGCDGKTYSNSCHAAGAGASVDYVGACAN